METNPKKKYATVQINIPIEICPNGEFTKHDDRITLKIIEIQELPPISTIDNTILKTTIQEMFSGIDEPKCRVNIYDDNNDDDEPCPFIIKSSLQESPRESPQESILQEFARDVVASKTLSQTEHMSEDDSLYSYIPKHLLENRTKTVSKNTTFKKTPKMRNKTRTNWRS